MVTEPNRTIQFEMSDDYLKKIAKDIKPYLLKEFNGNDDTNKSLDDLKQKLINDMYRLNFYEQVDVEILKILFENEKY